MRLRRPTAANRTAFCNPFQRANPIVGSLNISPAILQVGWGLGWIILLVSSSTHQHTFSPILFTNSCIAFKMHTPTPSPLLIKFGVMLQNNYLVVLIGFFQMSGFSNICIALGGGPLGRISFLHWKQTCITLFRKTVRTKRSPPPIEKKYCWVRILRSGKSMSPSSIQWGNCVCVCVCVSVELLTCDNDMVLLVKQSCTTWVCSKQKRINLNF